MALWHRGRSIDTQFPVCSRRRAILLPSSAKPNLLTSSDGKERRKKTCTRVVMISVELSWFVESLLSSYCLSSYRRELFYLLRFECEFIPNLWWIDYSLTSLEVTSLTSRVVITYYKSIRSFTLNCIVL